MLLFAREIVMQGLNKLERKENSLQSKS